MHELSIAMNIVDLAVEEAGKAGASTISKVEVEIGTMAGVEQEALLFAWDSVIQGTIAVTAKLVIHTIQGEAVCLECDKTFPVQNLFSDCPYCKGFRYRITRGKELRVSSLMVE
jgi:hydrogenase nickel incorporation protein HypA/HybF